MIAEFWNIKRGESGYWLVASTTLAEELAIPKKQHPNTLLGYSLRFCFTSK